MPRTWRRLILEMPAYDPAREVFDVVCYLDDAATDHKTVDHAALGTNPRAYDDAYVRVRSHAVGGHDPVGCALADGSPV
jgi:hypothetical protein